MTSSISCFFVGRDNQAQIRPCGSRADFAFSVTGQLGRIRASGVKKVERVFFRPCRPNVKGPNRFIRPQAGLCGLTELGLSGGEKDLSSGMQAFWVPGRPFSTIIRPYRPKKGLIFRLEFVALSADVFMASPRRHREDTLCVFPVSSPRSQTEATLEAKCLWSVDFDGNRSQREAKKDQKDVLKPK